MLTEPSARKRVPRAWEQIESMNGHLQTYILTRMEETWQTELQLAVPKRRRRLGTFEADPTLNVAAIDARKAGRCLSSIALAHRWISTDRN